MLKIMPIIATLLATPALADPCDVMDMATGSLRAATARAQDDCRGDLAVSDSCGRAINALKKAMAVSKKSMAHCDAVIARAEKEEAARKAGSPEWSYDPPPPWRPE